MSFSPDGKQIATIVAGDSNIQISDVYTGEKVCNLDAGVDMTEISWQSKSGSKWIAVARDSKLDSKNDTRTDFLRLISTSSAN
jgi:WD40 repeat protein